MGLVRKYRFEIIVSIGIVFLYLFLRLYQLTNLPMFTDEAIYIRWGQVALQDASWRFISLTDGKQPLFIWVMLPLLKFIQDPLLAGRLVSVFSGLITVAGLWALTYTLFKNKRIAFITALVYVCFPFAQVVDRMALYDSLSGALTVWALFFSVLIVRKPSLGLAYTLGGIIGFGVLNKSTNFFSIYLLPFLALIFDFSQKDKRLKLFNVIKYLLVATIVAYSMYAILRLSPFYHIVGQKNSLFIYPLSEWLTHPLLSIGGNFRGLIDWLFQYLNLSYVLLIILALSIKKDIRQKLLLFLFFLAPFIALGVFARIIFPRFIFFMVLSLLPLIGYSINYLGEKVSSHQLIKKTRKQSYIGYVVVAIFVAYPLFVSYKFAVDPVHAPIANADSGQYVNSWTAGWGLEKSIAYLEKEAKKGPIYIGTEGTFGLMPFAMEIYLVTNPNVTIKGFWPINDTLPTEVVEMSKVKPTYMIFYQPQHIIVPEERHLRLLQQTRMGTSQYTYRLYKVEGYR